MVTELVPAVMVPVVEPPSVPVPVFTERDTPVSFVALVGVPLAFWY